jgi:NOL1/NOP2/fmu family ribosome biogenesis protein
MKPNLRALSGRDLKRVLNVISGQWGADVDLPFAWYLGSRNALYVISRDIGRVDLRNLRINNVGLYFGEFKKGLLRLSIEGSQLVGPKAEKNVVGLDYGELRQWLRGEDLVKAVDAQGYVLVRYGSDFVGCGRVKDGRILNFVPKARRLLVSD